MEELHQHTQELSLVQHQTTRSLIEDVVHERNYDRQHQSLLDALAYPTINHRHDEIAEAHLKTYGWIFARPPVSAYSWSDFVSFLQNPGGIYWITGKPGSGKSTLMKFILEDKRFHDVLDSSSDEGEIITASFFAWSSGAELQKSLESMLRSLIYEMVDKCSKLLPKLYGREYPLPRSWTLKRLESMFNHEICQTGSTTRFVLIIDGLDELSGDLDRVIDLLKTAAANPHVKLIVSSRPWPIFEDAFDSEPTLQLHHLTQRDIMSFVQDRLGSNHLTRRLANIEPSETMQLVENVINKAAGVFLWVRMVVKSLLEGVRNQDTILDLKGRVERLPPNLEQLYDHMLAQVDPLYHAQASRLLQITLIAGGRLSAMQLWFAAEGVDVAIKANIHPVSRSEQLQATSRLKRWLSSRCAGLLELEPWQNSDIHNSIEQPLHIVQLMHRTVADYLLRGSTWSELQKRVEGTEFNAYVSLLSSSILMLKRGFRRLAFQDYSNIVDGALRYAYGAEKSAGVHQAILLEELDSTIRSLYDLDSRDIPLPLLHGFPESVAPLYVEHQHSDYDLMTDTDRSDFCGVCVDSELKHEGPGSNSPDSIAALAAAHGLCLYLETRLQLDQLTPDQDCLHSLLGYAMRFEATRPLSTDVTELLLKHGADPNHSTGGWSPFDRLLYFGYKRALQRSMARIGDMERQTGTECPEEGWRSFINVFKLLVIHGANPARLCDVNDRVSTSFWEIYSEPATLPLKVLEVMEAERLLPRNVEEIKARAFAIEVEARDRSEETLRYATIPHLRVQHHNDLPVFTWLCTARADERICFQPNRVFPVPRNW